MSADATTVNVSLLSHTNVGKTTLARTLLRQDIGEVADRPHVTEFAAANVLVASPEGDRLVLWDTPGFGDSARLLRRLQRSGNALGWFLRQVWDRFTDRPFWCSQQAMRNAREESDVVLYVVNASEDPDSAAYVQAEMQILTWIGKPIVLLLNQLGAPRDRAADRADVERWRAHLANFPDLRGVLPFDAFARCWVLESTLLAEIETALPEAKRAAAARLGATWRARDLGVFESSMRVVARQLAAVAADSEQLPERGAADRARAYLTSIATGAAAADPALDRGQRALAERLDRAVRDSTDELVRLHGLTGRATEEILQRMGSEF
ncbi:MAG TPA: GTPase domain-containing protein, partial [Steroidobacteraceae bacterium]|nr:GTPase domain-containing protein [Steroidobacteraceae bacterium]